MCTLNKAQYCTRMTFQMKDNRIQKSIVVVKCLQEIGKT